VGPAQPGDDIAMVVVRRRNGATPAGIAADERPAGIAADERPADAAVYQVDLAALGMIRRAVAQHGRDQGMAEQPLQDLVLIVNELASNVVTHGGGTGTLALWYADGFMHCQVSDDGPGMPDPVGVGTVATDPDTITGRGLWLIRQMSDQLEINSCPQGTTVTVAVSVTEPQPH
jgi:anti-sigma regulatory factor (Ser/Thr protein kinase)